MTTSKVQDRPRRRTAQDDDKADSGPHELKAALGFFDNAM